MTKMCIAFFTQPQQLKSMAIPGKASLILLIIMRDGCISVTTIKEVMCGAFKCSRESTHVVGSSYKEGWVTWRASLSPMSNEVPGVGGCACLWLLLFCSGIAGTWVQRLTQVSQCCFKYVLCKLDLSHMSSEMEEALTQICLKVF